MQRQRIVIVGGTASGPAAAAEARRADPEAEIVLFERGPHVSVGACELPHLAVGAVDDPNDVIRLSPQQLAISRGIDVRVHHEVIDLDLRASRITVVDHARGVRATERVDKLVLSTGARATWAGLDGVDEECCFRLRTIDDAARLRAALDRGAGGHVVVVGAGFVGLELASLLADAGRRVTVLDPGGPLRAHLDAPLQAVLDDRLARAGIAVRRDRAVAVRRPAIGPRIAIRTEGGELVGCTLVVVAAGIEPVSDLGGPGLVREANGTYRVDASMRTSARPVWACGDCVSVPSAPGGRHRWIPLSPVAFRSARVAGHNAARRGRLPARSLPPPVGNFTARIAGWEVASVGLTAARARAAGFDAGLVSILHRTASSLHAQARPIHVGLVFDRREGTLLGAQILGEHGATLRADVVAAVMAGGGTVSDLYEVDYAYAPPVAPALDPLMVAARAAQKDRTSR